MAKGSTNPTENRLEIYVPKGKRIWVRKLKQLAKKERTSSSAMMLKLLEQWIRRRSRN